MPKYVGMVAAVISVGVLCSAGWAAEAATAAAEQETASGVWVFPPGMPTAYFGLGIGLALLVMGAARGIGHIGASAVEAIARQPEAGGRIFTSMLLSAALIEGFTLFAIVVAMLLAFK